MPSPLLLFFSVFSRLMAAAKLIGTDCAAPNKAFMLCKQKNADPAACLEPGTNVVACVMDVHRRATSDACAAGFEAYRACLRDNNDKFERCRDEQHALRKCFDAQK